MSFYFGYAQKLLTTIRSAMITQEGSGPLLPYPELIVYDAAVIPEPTEKITTEVELIKYQLRFPVLPDDPIDSITSDANNYYLNMIPVTPVLTLADGTAKFFRLNAVSPLSNGSFFARPVLQGTVTDRTGDGPLKLPTITIGAGIYVRATLIRITLPYIYS